VFIDERMELLPVLAPQVLVDARLKKRALDTRLEMAPLVVGLGPGFVVGQHCHAVVETQRGHTLGRVYATPGAAALPDTGIPESVAGHTAERVLRAPCNGALLAQVEIGALLEPGAVVCTVAGRVVSAPFAGVLRGLLQSGLQVAEGEKIGDVDPRSNRAHCFTISDKALAIAGGVLEAVLHASLS
jgi:xanthine dehydrogenase accessory factor